MANTNLRQQLFGNLDFKTIRDNKDFKEDSVREVVILPILKELGYTQDHIVRSKSLQSPFLKIGSKKRQIQLIPDYVMKVENNFAWVLDAKSPNQKIENDDNVEQVYSYATHPEIRSTYFALCNGIDFSVFRTNDTNKHIFLFHIEEIDDNWNDFKRILSPNSFQVGVYITNFDNNQFDYVNRPLLEELPVKKQTAKRHFGVHGYFTKQSWNVVSEYIKNFSRTDDLILDPFGGSGVTAVEAMMCERRAINVDLNPMAVFLVQSLVAPVNQNELLQAFIEVKDEYLKHEPKTDEDIQKAIRRYPQIKQLQLPQNSDVETVDQLFSDKQKAQLSFLKHLGLKFLRWRFTSA